MRVPWYGIALLLPVFLLACPSSQDGSLAGAVIPAAQDVLVSVTLNGTSVASQKVSGDGRFQIPITPGTYEVRVSSPAAPLPLVLSQVEVRPGETTDLGTLQFATRSGRSVIRGRVKNATAGTTVALLADGMERSAVRTGADGTYLFEHLEPARYTVRVSTPAYADTLLPVTVRDDQVLDQDIRQLYITYVEGADWTNGVLRSRGVGLPPPQAQTPSVRRELAKRAALADAERNMLRLIELLQVGPERKLTDLLGTSTNSSRLQGYLKGYRISADRDLNGGRVEIEIELPLTGPDGLTAFLEAP